MLIVCYLRPTRLNFLELAQNVISEREKKRVIATKDSRRRIKSKGIRRRNYHSYERKGERIESKAMVDQRRVTNASSGR